MQPNVLSADAQLRRDLDSDERCCWYLLRQQVFQTPLVMPIPFGHIGGQIRTIALKACVPLGAYVIKRHAIYLHVEGVAVTETDVIECIVNVAETLMESC